MSDEPIAGRENRCELIITIGAFRQWEAARNLIAEWNQAGKIGAAGRKKITLFHAAVLGSTLILAARSESRR